MKTKNYSAGVVAAHNVVVSVTKYGTCSGSSSTTYLHPAWRPHEETISYDVGRRKTNRCYHLREISSRNKLPLYGTGSISPHTCKQTEIVGESSLLWTDNWHLNPYGCPSIVRDDPLWRTYSSEAVQAMWPEVESRLSTGNFLLELPEVRDLPRFLPELLKLAKKSKSKPLGSLVKGSSNSALFSEFALRPLISDLLGFHQVFMKARADVKRILDNENKPLVSHYQKRLSLTKNFDFEGTQFADGYGTNRWRLNWRLEEAWYRATMRYRYILLDYQRTQAYDLGLWDSLGLNLNPAIIWNALPWSFVVDWIARVGDFLDQAKIRNLEPIVSIDGFCHSYKVSYRVTQSFAEKYDRTPYGQFSQCGTYAKSLYIREPYVPDTYTAIRLSGVNSREFILGGALLGSRR